jgi:cytochrome c-type biogenesis protein
MIAEGVLGLVLLPLGLGLLGFIEPCTVGSSLLFLHYLEGRSAPEQVAQTLVFTAVRAVAMGLLGVIAVAVGAVFVDFQKGAWAVMGVLYIALGAAYLVGSIDRLKRSLGPGLGRLAGRKGGAILGAIFAVNIPACAGPLLVALLGTAAISPTRSYAGGFTMLAIFGLALTVPLTVAVFWTRGRRFLEWIGRFSSKAPRIIGAIFIVLGLWSIRFALVAEVLGPG